MTPLVHFGFEFETLLDVSGHGQLKAELEDLDHDFMQSSCQDIHYLDQEGHRIPDRPRDSYIQRRMRHGICTLLNEEVLKHNYGFHFTFNNDYGEPPCYPKTAPSGANHRFFAVTHDPSVKLKQHEERGIPLYTRLQGDKPASHAHLNDSPHILESIEIVSPKLCIDELDQGFFRGFMSGNMSGVTYLNNSTTSNHIHFSVGDQLKDPKKLYKLCTYWLYFEPLFIRMFPWWRQQNEYATSMYTCLEAMLGDKDRVLRMLYNLTAHAQKLDTDPDNGIHQVIAKFQGNPHEHESRYACFNILNMLPGCIGTVEVRLKHGSTDEDELKNYTAFFARFIVGTLNLNVMADEFVTTCIQRGRLPPFTRAIIWEALTSGSEPFDKITIHLHTLYEMLRVFFQDTMNNLQPFLGQEFLGKYTDAVLLKFAGSQAQLMSTKLPMEEVDLHMEGAAHVTDVFIYTFIDTPSIVLKNRVKAATLNDHTLVFAGASKAWSGAVATIHPQKKTFVEGALVTDVCPCELKVLDREHIGYSRETRYVTLHGTRKRVLAHVYVKKSTEYKGILPSTLYMRCMRKLRERSGLTVSPEIPIHAIPEHGKRPVCVGVYRTKTGKITNAHAQGTLTRRF